VVTPAVPPPQTTDEAFAQAFGGDDSSSGVPPYTTEGIPDNQQYWNTTEFDSGQILDSLGTAIAQGLAVVSGQMGWTQNETMQLFESIWANPQGGINPFLDSLWAAANQEQESWNTLKGSTDARNITIGAVDPGAYQGTGKQEKGAWYYTQEDGFRELVARTWDFFNSNTSVDLGQYPLGAILGSGSRRGGGGSRGPTAQDIRNQFDVDQLAERASNIWRGMLLEDTSQARSFAQSYVDTMVEHMGKKKIDFDTFIRNKARETARYASIYRSKPDALTEEQFLQPYYQSALQIVRPDNADEVAIGGAQFGSDASTFAARLRRTDESTSSSNFINELEQRMTGLNNLFKG
jgi:hypothetical protein